MKFTAVLLTVVFMSSKVAMAAIDRVDCQSALDTRRGFGNIQLDRVSSEFGGIIDAYFNKTGVDIGEAGEAAVVLAHKGLNFTLQGSNASTWFSSKIIEQAQIDRTTNGSILKDTAIQDIKLSALDYWEWFNVLLLVCNEVYNCQINRFNFSAEEIDRVLSTFSFSQREAIFLAHLSGPAVIRREIYPTELATKINILRAGGFKKHHFFNIAQALLKNPRFVRSKFSSMSADVDIVEKMWVSSRPR